MTVYEQFLQALRDRDLERVRQLAAANPRAGDLDGEEGPILWCLADDRPVLLAALEAGLDPNVGEAHGNPLLHTAACRGWLDVLGAALARHADLDLRNDSGETALGFASAWEQPAAVEMLLKAGANVNAIEEDPATGYRGTALDAAVSDAMRSLLRGHGALGELDANQPPR